MSLFDCTKCGSPTTIQGQVVLSAPSQYYHNFTKSNLRRKGVYLMGCLWETFDFICTNPKCGHTVGRYGNYVTSIKKENEALKARIRELEASGITRPLSTGG